MSSVAVRVNADYESVLFHQRPQPKINQAIEFLALFLEDAPLLSSLAYGQRYLDHVASVFGKERRLISKGPAVNWWGPLSDLEKERRLNSKLTSTQLALDEKWVDETFILTSTSDIPTSSRPMIAKDPFDMSGRGFRLFPDGVQEKDLRKVLEKGVHILEPLRNRRHDFSHYVFRDGHEICYQNLVDHKFQYKGTLFQNWMEAREENLSFSSQISSADWERARVIREKIKQHYFALAGDFGDGFSIDSFTFEEDHKLRLQIMCEVNYRRTMGRVAYDLSRRYAHGKPWTLFLLLPEVKDLLDKLPTTNQWIVLSPEQSRFSMIFLMAKDAKEGKEVLGRVQNLLSLSELPVGLED